MNSQTIGNQVNQIEKTNIHTESTEVKIVSKRLTLYKAMGLQILIHGYIHVSLAQ